VGLTQLPTSGRVFIDTNVLIYVGETVTPWFDLVRPLFEAHERGELYLVASEIIVPEVLVLPLRAGDAELRRFYEMTLFGPDGMELLPVTLPVLLRAAELRASASLKTPDAIHLATVERHAADAFVTNDADMADVATVPTLLLHELG
jgi:predicted nucleic acid-binding protein